MTHSKYIPIPVEQNDSTNDDPREFSIAIFDSPLPSDEDDYPPLADDFETIVDNAIAINIVMDDHSASNSFIRPLLNRILNNDYPQEESAYIILVESE